LQKELLKILNDVEAAPGTQIQTGNAGATNLGIPIVPSIHQHAADAADREEVRNPDKRVRDEHSDKRQAKGELYDKESDVDAGRHHEPAAAGSSSSSSSSSSSAAGAAGGAGEPAAKRMRLWDGKEGGNESGGAGGAGGSGPSAGGAAGGASSSSSNAMHTE
jgi:hypothetical protein